jgi:DNA-binding NarL/FixJ family response regulator
MPSTPGHATPPHGQPESAPEVDVTVLSYVEHRALIAFSRGLSRNQIARTLRISPRTVGRALTVAKEKLFARSLTEAAVLLRLSDVAPTPPGDRSPPDD